MQTETPFTTIPVARLASIGIKAVRINMDEVIVTFGGDYKSPIAVSYMIFDEGFDIFSGHEIK